MIESDTPASEFELLTNSAYIIPTQLSQAVYW